MHKVTRESGDLVARHDLDGLLLSATISAEPAELHQLAALAEIANREIPGVNASEAGLTQFLRDDPESIFAFRRRETLLGGIAFLYLNCRGQDALLLDNIDLKNPGREFLARGGEEVSAIYVWALAGYGRAAIGLGNVAARLRRPRFIGADYFAQPSTAAGRDLLVALGFKSTPSYQPDLWRYERRSQHFPIHMPAPISSARSFLNAWQ
ncbi:hypothetical protein [uncultured Bradyrhizobium sp.]|uniref:hypothetical protein n=1 Tax=uncultured Bradyrhizobium sp. TaxID=199684 RepID=UPI0035CB625B